MLSLFLSPLLAVAPVAEDAQTYSVLAQFAKCVVRREREIARALLAVPSGSNEEGELMSDLVSGRCLPAGIQMLRMQSSTYRAAIAEALFVADRKDGMTFPVLGDAPPLAGLAGHEMGIAFAQCVARADRVDAEALFATEIESPEELEVVGRLQPMLNPCLGEGRSLRLNRASLRGLLAEAMYRDLHMAVSPETNGPVN
ncbi:hypothetical protein [Sphingosinithalassobacter portus]|uniref:hypothetical protein n=1 Tax=Stakelama portus TaxID=2676234 RepID=UPI0011AB60FA|nr:hypothetical protein [Sphingosinithalassobacter portus]